MGIFCPPYNEDFLPTLQWGFSAAGLVLAILSTNIVTIKHAKYWQLHYTYNYVNVPRANIVLNNCN
jgi:hypothetical protein